MEFNTKSDEQALRLQKLLKNEGFNSKITYRKGYNVVYIKGSEEIADILGYMGAAQGAFELFSVQIEKEMRNEVNRRVNCENANTNKAAKAHLSICLLIKKSRTQTMGQTARCIKGNSDFTRRISRGQFERIG